jgi:hypothetical protein
MKPARNERWLVSRRMLYWSISRPAELQAGSDGWANLTGYAIGETAPLAFATPGPRDPLGQLRAGKSCCWTASRSDLPPLGLTCLGSSHTRPCGVTFFSPELESATPVRRTVARSTCWLVRWHLHCCAVCDIGAHTAVGTHYGRIGCIRTRLPRNHYETQSSPQPPPD